MFIRSKQVKKATYYQLVEGYRDEAGRVRHRNIISLGRHATVDAAIAAARKQLRVVERQETMERESCPPSSYRPPSSSRRLAALELKRERLAERIDALACARNALAQQRTRARLAQPPAAASPAVSASLLCRIGRRTGRTLWQVLNSGLSEQELLEIEKLSDAELCQKLTRSEPRPDVVTVSLGCRHSADTKLNI